MLFDRLFNRSGKSEILSTLIDTSVRIQGDLRFDRNTRIDGTIVGDIHGTDDDHGTLIVGPSGRVEGNVHCHTVIVLGHVAGNLQASHVEMRSGGRIDGDVHYDILETHQGAHVNGRLVRKAPRQAAPSPALTPGNKPRSAS